MQQTVDALVDMYIQFSMACERHVWIYGIFRVRLCVCSFNQPGNAKASRCGTSKQYGSHAFFITNQSPTRRVRRYHCIWIAYNYFLKPPENPGRLAKCLYQLEMSIPASTVVTVNHPESILLRFVLESVKPRLIA